MIRFLGVRSKAGFIIFIALFFVLQTSCDGRDSSLIFFVNFNDMPQEYLGILNPFASLHRVEVPILFAIPFLEYASAPNNNKSHFFNVCSAARSGETITFIFDFVRSSAVCLPWRRGSTSVV